MNKIVYNIIAFLSAILLANLLVLVNKDLIVNYYLSLNSMKKTIDKTKSLQHDLEIGKIIIFASSELDSHNHKFIPQNYFNKNLKMPLVVNGHAGHQSFAILSELASLSNKKVKDNARVVVILSPGWFQGDYSKGTEIPKFLEYIYSGMLYKLYYESDVSDYYKSLIGQYIKNNMKDIKNPSYIYKYASEYKLNSSNSIQNMKEKPSYIYKHTSEYKLNSPMDSLQKIFTKEIIKDIYTKEVMKNINTEEIVKDNHSNEPSQNTISYSNPNLDYALIRKEALIVAKPSTNNKIGVHNEYYTRHVEPKIIKGEFPYTISTPPLKENQEYKDFLNLVKILKSYKIKPLFIMQDQSPLAFVYNRKSMEPLLMNIKTELNKYGYGYLDMWTYNPKDYVLGTLTDIMHMGELGWVDVDKKIIEHFMSGEKDED